MREENRTLSIDMNDIFLSLSTIAVSHVTFVLRIGTDPLNRKWQDMGREMTRQRTGRWTTEV